MKEKLESIMEHLRLLSERTKKKKAVRILEIIKVEVFNLYWEEKNKKL